MNFHLAEFLIREVGFFGAGFWRYLVCALSFVPLLAVNWKKFKGISLLTFGGMVVIGVFLFAFNYFFFKGLKDTDPLNASLIVSLNPIITSVLAVILIKEKISRGGWWSLAIALVGVAVIVTRGHLERLVALDVHPGDLFILVAVSLFALQHITVRKFVVDTDIIILTGVSSIICLVFFAPFAGEVGLTPDHSWVFYAAALGIGFLGTTLAFLFWNNGIRAIGPVDAAVYGNLIPLVTSLISIVKGEELYLYQLIGGVVILIGLNFKRISRLLKASV